MTVHLKVIDPETSAPETLFLCNVEYDDGSVEGLTNVILKELNERNISDWKMAGLGTDGAKVMLREGKGVYVRLKEKIHISSGYTALPTGLPCPPARQQMVCSTWRGYRSEWPPSSTISGHQALGKVLEHPVLKIREIYAVRWLSFYEAVDAIYHSITPQLTYFESRKLAKDPQSPRASEVHGIWGLNVGSAHNETCHPHCVKVKSPVQKERRGYHLMQRYVSNQMWINAKINFDQS